MENLLAKLEEKFKKDGQDSATYLKGLYHAKYVNYWDYIQPDTLLTLQKPRTDFPDEVTFIAYHQITELVLMLIKHEANQLCENENFSEAYWLEKGARIERYVFLLINSFSIMNKGMSKEQYNEFRLSLAPASGFQSAQFRLIEFLFTDIENLINERGKSRINQNASVQEKLENIYWQDAGKNHETGQKSKTLQDFENKYKSEFLLTIEKYQEKNISYKIEKMKSLGLWTSNLNEQYRRIDKALNIDWPIVHMETAHTYLSSDGESKAATGGSNWVKYLHPKYQRRIYFPSLWTKTELANWGN